MSTGMKTENYISYQLLQKKRTIRPIDKKAGEKVRRRWDSLAKPLDSLGKFEELTARMGAILEDTDFNWKRRAVLVMCADNGVVAEGISQCGQEVTLAVCKSMGQKKSSVGKMAEVNGTRVFPIDIGIASEEEIPGVENFKIAPGTKNFATEPAMSEEEVYQAMDVGISLVKRCKDQGFSLVAMGEMGIGNTTTATAVAAACLKLPAVQLVGKGAGLSDEGLQKKERVIQEAIDTYDLYEATPFQILQTVGGLDLAGMVGIILGGAYYHIPIVLDGILSVVAALVTYEMLPETLDFLIPTHVSKEKVASRILEKLGMKPVICGDLALGEGTGAVMFFSLLDTAMALYEDGTSFEKMQVETYQRFE